MAATPSSVLSSVAATSHAQAPDLTQVEKRSARPVLGVAKPKAAPAIDGKLDDACWNDARPVTLGYSIGAWWTAPSQKTEARVLADEQAIYFAVRCFEAEPERIVASGTARKGMVVGADTVEFFLDPGCQRKRHEYFHVIVTPDGSVYRGTGLDAGRLEGARHGQGRASSQRGWTVEAAVPLADLGLKAGAIPKVWGLNICRQRPELAYDMPKAARDAGNKRFDPPMWKLDEPTDVSPGRVHLLVAHHGGLLRLALLRRLPALPLRRALRPRRAGSRHGGRRRRRPSCSRSSSSRISTTARSARSRTPRIARRQLSRPGQVAGLRGGQEHASVWPSRSRTWTTSRCS